MEKQRLPKTYERHSQKHKAKESKQLSDLFDKIADKHSPTQEHQKLYRRRTIGRNISVLRKKMTSTKLVPHTGSMNKKSREGPLETMFTLAETPEKTSSIGLFGSPCETESTPKRAKQAILHSCRKRVKKNGKKSDMHVTQHKAAKQLPVLGPATSGSTFSSYPDIETVRDVKQASFDWSFVYKMDQSHNKSSLSLSDSCAETLIEPSGREQPFPVPEPWAPTGVRKRSFIKIRTPSQHAGESSQTMSITQDGDNKKSEMDSSSYVSMYTWTTASSTVTSAPHSGSPDPSAQPEGQPDSSSPTLMLKSYVQDNLHSTAIYPHQDIRLLQQTPQVSPIKVPTDDDESHRTPCVPTHDVSPRGPRKTCSFLSMPARSVAPKCSTMLFSSPIADAGGDAPLDVSSIRMALSEAVDLNEDADKERENQRNQRAYSKVMDDKVLTSTPSRSAPSKLKWNLSAVEAVFEEDELVPLQTSGDTVNSQEILAASLSDMSIGVSPLQPEEVAAEGDGGGGDLHSRPESGVMKSGPQCSKTSHQETKQNQISHPEKFGHFGSNLGAQLIPSQLSYSSKHCEENRGENVQQGSHIDNRGDGCGSNRKACSEIGILSTERKSQEKEYPESYNLELEQTQSAKDRGDKYELLGDITNMLCKQSKRQMDKSLQQQIANVEDEIECCPVSASGLRDKACTPKSTERKPSLLMWVEPADSGFLDMVASTPPGGPRT